VRIEPQFRIGSNTTFATFIWQPIDFAMKKWALKECRRGAHLRSSDPEHWRAKIQHTGFEIADKRGALAAADEASQEDVSASMEGLGAEDAEPVDDEAMRMPCGAQNAELYEQLRGVFSERDYEIVIRVVLGQQSQRDTAAHLGISESYLSKLIGKEGRITLGLKKFFGRE
jgi:DNA-directed RNA polymerase specialized sigma subunit